MKRELPGVGIIALVLACLGLVFVVFFSSSKFDITCYKPRFSDIPVSIQNTSLKVDTFGGKPMVYLELGIVNNHEKSHALIAMNCYVDLKVWYEDASDSPSVTHSGMATATLNLRTNEDDVPFAIMWLYHLQNDPNYSVDTVIEKIECVFYVTWMGFTGKDKNQWGDKNLTAEDNEFIIANATKFYVPAYVA